jgi:hypothetical protein
MNANFTGRSQSNPIPVDDDAIITVDEQERRRRVNEPEPMVIDLEQHSDEEVPDVGGQERRRRVNEPEPMVIDVEQHSDEEVPDVGGNSVMGQSIEDDLHVCSLDDEHDDLLADDSLSHLSDEGQVNQDDILDEGEGSDMSEVGEVAGLGVDNGEAAEEVDQDEDGEEVTEQDFDADQNAAGEADWSSEEGRGVEEDGEHGEAANEQGFEVDQGAAGEADLSSEYKGMELTSTQMEKRPMDRVLMMTTIQQMNQIGHLKSQFPLHRNVTMPVCARNNAFRQPKRRMKGHKKGKSALHMTWEEVK